MNCDGCKNRVWALGDWVPYGNGYVRLPSYWDCSLGKDQDDCDENKEEDENDN